MDVAAVPCDVAVVDQSTVSRRHGFEESGESGNVARKRLNVNLLLDVIENVAAKAALGLIFRVVQGDQAVVQNPIRFCSRLATMIRGPSCESVCYILWGGGAGDGTGVPRQNI